MLLGVTKHYVESQGFHCLVVNFRMGLDGPVSHADTRCLMSGCVWMALSLSGCLRLRNVSFF